MADSQAFCVAEERSGHCAVVDGHFLYVWGGYVVRGRGGRAGAARERRLGGRDDCRYRGTPSGFQEARLRSAPHSPRAARGRPGSPNHPTGVPGCVPPPASVAQDWRRPLDSVLCYTVFIATVTKQLNVSAIFSGISLLIKYLRSLKNRFVFATPHHGILWLKIRIAMAVGM